MLPRDWLNTLQNEGLLIASNNPHKITEIQRILSGFSIPVFGLADKQIELEVAETAADFAGNARLKAAAANQLSGLPALADDSGICVQALNGRPGVHSARYGGPDLDDRQRVERLLSEMSAVPAKKRQAWFHCSVVILARPFSGSELLFEAQAHGQIAFDVRGNNGFGYDPVFIDAKSGHRFSELKAAQKDQRSHRGQALRQLVEFLYESN